MKLPTRLALTAAIAAALFFLFALSAHAQAPPTLEHPSVVTDGLANGYAWKIWDSHAQLAFTKGFMEGAALLLGAVKDQVSDEYIYPKTEADLEAAITAFYSDPLNAKIPILAAYLHITAKEQGATSQQLKEHLDRLRQKSNQSEGEMFI